MTKHKQLEVGEYRGRALVQPGTLDKEKRTFEVVFATEYPVKRYSWSLDGYYNEVLDCRADAVLTDRLDNGAPFLRDHNGWNIDAQLGVIESYRFEGGKGYATIRLSQRDDVQKYVQDIEDGILRNISVGYKVHRYEKQVVGENDVTPTYRAVSWEPMEISLVSVPADPGSGVRSENEKRYFVPIGNETEESSKPNMDPNQDPQTRGEGGAGAPTPTPPAAPAPTAEEIRAAEKKRISEIRAAVSTAKLGDDFALRMIEEGHELDQVRALVIEEIGKRQATTTPTVQVTTRTDQVDKRRAAMTDALMLRAGAKVEKPSDGSNQYRGMSLLRMAEDVLTEGGVDTRGMSPREIAETALGVRAGYHSTSDFPIILGNTVNRTLRAAYDLQQRTFMPFCTRTTAANFKEITRAQISGMVGTFDEVKEGGEYKYATMTEGKETYKLVKYGKKIAITWESIINDDLSAFTRIPAAIAAAAAQKQSDIVWNLLLNNPAMGDGVSLFHATHKNLGSASAINEAGLDAARKAMRNQTSLEGTPINVYPAYMMVGPDKETEAQKLLQGVIMATKTAYTNVFRSFTELIVEPRITGNKWFLAANPNMIDTIEYAFLEGEGELFTEQRVGYDVDGLEIKARMVFAAKAIDHRGLYYNPGA